MLEMYNINVLNNYKNKKFMISRIFCIILKKYPTKLNPKDHAH